MKLYKTFFLLTRGKQIAISVCLLHFFAIFGLTIHHFASRRLKPPRPMVVKTLMQPKPQQSVVEVKAPAAKAETPKPVKKNVAAAPKPKPKTLPSIKSPPVPEDKLLKQLAQTVKTPTTESAPKRAPLTIPSALKQKAEIAPESKTDPTDGELLIAYLQNALDLPEYGDVKAKIEIDRFGNLVDCQILEAKSLKNAEFLKNRLPELTFPCLNGSQSFTITFCNVENR